MSEPIPESIPTSADPRSKRPIKKRSLTPVSAQANQVEALFAKPPSDLDFAKPSPKSLAAPPEIVTNVQGSSAGAGSGEFHVYKASRRREYERVAAMESEALKEKEDREHEEKMGQLRKKDDEKLNKNQKRRQKMKERQMKKKKGGDSGGDEVETGQATKKKKKNLGPARLTQQNVNGDEDEEDEGGEVQAVALEEEVGITIQDDD
jgi:hypothetical protein